MKRARYKARTLITGGFGFLATWIAAGLRRHGHELVLVDHRELKGSPVWLSGLLMDPAVTTARADVTMPGALDPFDSVDNVIHAAGIVGVDAVRRAPSETLRVNIQGTATVLSYAVHNPSIRRFVLISTSEVYGVLADGAAEGQWLSVRTDDSRWTYAASKITAESMTYSYGLEKQIPFVVIRPFNIYGPLRTGRYAIGDFTAQALRGGPLTIHGSGAQTRAWCHAEDFAHGAASCLSSDNSVGKTLNIGDDRHSLTILELARQIRDMSVPGASIVHIEPDPCDVQQRVPNLERARMLLKYKPFHCFDRGLRETIEWRKSPAHTYAVRLIRDDWPDPA